jgi:hypothetical protein
VFPYDAPCSFDITLESFSPKSLTANDKEWLGAQLYYEKFTSLELSKIYNIPSPTLRTYKIKVMRNENFRDNVGRPTLVDEIGLQEFVKEFQGKKYQTTVKEFPKRFLNHAVLTAKRRRESSTLSISASDRSHLRYMKKLKLYRTKAEQSTAARLEACSCHRNLFTFITANSIMTSISPKHLILNMDSTQFAVGGDANENIDVIIHEGDRIRNLKCKYYLIYSAKMDNVEDSRLLLAVSTA